MSAGRGGAARTAGPRDAEKETIVNEDDIARISMTGELDAHAAETLRLMIRRLARQHGVELVELTIEPADDDDSA